MNVASIPYAEFAVTTAFSFLRGASHPEEMVETALALGHAGMAVADRNTLAGVVRPFSRLKALRKAAAETGDWALTERLARFRYAVGSHQRSASLSILAIEEVGKYLLYKWFTGTGDQQFRRSWLTHKRKQFAAFAIVYWHVQQQAMIGVAKTLAPHDWPRVEADIGRNRQRTRCRCEHLTDGGALADMP